MARPLKGGSCSKTAMWQNYNNSAKVITPQCCKRLTASYWKCLIFVVAAKGGSTVIRFSKQSLFPPHTGLYRFAFFPLNNKTLSFRNFILCFHMVYLSTI